MSDNLVLLLRKYAIGRCDGCCYGECMLDAASHIEKIEDALRRIADAKVEFHFDKDGNVDPLDIAVKFGSCLVRLTEIAKNALGRHALDGKA